MKFCLIDGTSYKWDLGASMFLKLELGGSMFAIGWGSTPDVDTAHR